MENGINNLLSEEISNELNCLGKIEIGTDTYKVAVEGISKLMDKKIEIEKLEQDLMVKSREYELQSRKLNMDSKKLEQDYESKNEEHKIEKDKLKQIENDKNDQIFKNSIAIAGIVIPSLITIWGTFKTLKFEETGTVTTIMGRGFVNKLIPKKWELNKLKAEGQTLAFCFIYLNSITGDFYEIPLQKAIDIFIKIWRNVQL